MKPIRLYIANIGKVQKAAIEINKPLILFYGEIKQGKTTILNSVRWVCGGEFPQDIISHGQTEASIELHFDTGMISRSFYVAKDGTTKARPVTFVKNGRPVNSPVTEIKRLLNPFLLDQDFLRNKNELERKKYFTELFEVDTVELDTELFNCTRDAQALRAKIAGYGDIDLTPVERVDIAALEAGLKSIRDANAKTEKEHDAKCDEFNKRLNYRSEIQRDVVTIQRDIKDLEDKLSNLRAGLEARKSALEAAPILPEPAEPIYIGTEEVELKLREAGAKNVRAEQYEAAKRRAAEKAQHEATLTATEKRQREIRAEKQRKLKEIGDSCGIAGLSFDEDGNFIYDGTTAGMISDSQIMRLSSELSALYPEGFGLDLIDRAESLGKSIFEFVDRANAEKKSILATIVGERPATVPENVGVFVVENGTIK